MRVAALWPWGPLARGIVFRYVRRFRSGPNTLIDSYRAGPESQACAEAYALTGRGSNDLFRDLIVLKSPTASESGVILLKYADAFDAVVALFDLDRLRARYRFVLEPCWAGLCLPSLLMFLCPQQPVIVQCFTREDLDFVREVGYPFVPIALGPADWVDADIFQPADADAPKTHDLVMVANWGAHKRHAQLFRALSTLQDRPLRVLLIGFPWSGRTADDIRREAEAFGNGHVSLEIVERIPAAEVAQRVSRCKAFVFLSRKEGDNKALVEAMFSDVPVIVYDKSIGGAVSRVNEATGVLTSDAGLAGTIQHVLSRYREFRPRAWAMEHTGSAVATRILKHPCEP